MKEMKTTKLIRFGIKQKKKKKKKLLPKLVSLFLRTYYSMEVIITEKSELGTGVRFSHNGLGTVVGPNVKIGNGCRIYQNVTLGANRKMIDGIVTNDGYPTIEDEVVIYAGAVIAGPVTIGSGSIIGANTVVTTDVPEKAIVKAGKPVVKTKS
jgi:serine O-acetyltransferase